MTQAGLASSQSSTRVPDGNGRDEVFRLLRYSHIFASVVREFLELQLLHEVSDEDLSLSQLHLLKLITLDGEHQMGQVAEFLGISPPAATKNIDKMERLGLVSRIPSTGDRRATLLQPSRQGRKLVSRYEALKEDRLAPVLEGFNKKELKQMADLLERFSLRLIHAQEPMSQICLRCSAYYDEHCPIPHLQNGCPYKQVRQLGGAAQCEGEG
ncbi:MAG: MarR family transcriptional regulator [Thermoanaerobaculia bacterium]|jgi:DNA-binding MarR family transcriptional regulator